MAQMVVITPKLWRCNKQTVYGDIAAWHYDSALSNVYWSPTTDNDNDKERECYSAIGHSGPLYFYFFYLTSIAAVGM